MGEERRIDALYRAFCESLPADLSEPARSLAFRLKLVPAPGIPWSAVFKHAVTLEAPALFIEAEGHVEDRVRDRAALAHMLSIIEAFGTDRIADGQTTDGAELQAILAHMRAARDRALVEIGGAEAAVTAAASDRKTVESIESERALLLSGAPVTFAVYENVSSGKQAVGLPSTLTLARAAGFEPDRLETVRSTLMGIWLGLQFQDDVVDWEDDVTHGGAWAVALALDETKTPSHGSSADAEPGPELRKLVLSSGVLEKMLERSFRQFEAARRGTETLGCERLSAWLREREVEAADYVEHERKSPGYLVRLRKLSPWAREVLG